MHFLQLLIYKFGTTLSSVFVAQSNVNIAKLHENYEVITMPYDIVRRNQTKYTRFPYEYNAIGRAIHEYDGGFQADEDVADYLSRRMTVKAVRLA